MITKFLLISFTLVVQGCLCGCQTPVSRVSFAAADAHDAILNETRAVILEYDADLSARLKEDRADGAKALAARIQSKPDDAALVQQNINDFLAFNAKLDADTETLRFRRDIALDNLEVGHEIAGDTRQFAINSMQLDVQSTQAILDAVAALQAKQTAESVAESQPKDSTDVKARIIERMKHRATLKGKIR